MSDQPDKLRLGWVIYEEVGMSIINDYTKSDVPVKKYIPMRTIRMDRGIDRAIHCDPPVFADNYNHLIDTMITYAKGHFERIELSGECRGCGGKTGDNHCNCKRRDRIDTSLEFADWLLNNQDYLPKEIILGSFDFIDPFEEIQLKIKLGGVCVVKRWGERETDL